MTDKEFKRLSRAQLIDIIYQLQLQIDTLHEEKQAVETASAIPESGVRMETAAKVSFGKRVSGSMIW
mgnify:CR=1 FL=1